MRSDFGNILIISPCRNESSNIQNLVTSLEKQNIENLKLILAINNSTDNSYELATQIKSPILIKAERLQGEGNLSTAFEYFCFIKFADDYFLENSAYTHVMKLDADVRLEPDYFKKLISTSNGRGVVGAPLRHEQQTSISGAVKIYSREAYKVIREIPTALGFDVIDEYYISRASLPVEILKDCHFSLVRKTGSSEGQIRGRFRNGKVCKYVNYSPLYFSFKLLRFLFIKPYLVGMIALLFGYLLSNNSPFERAILDSYRNNQHERLRFLMTNPLVAFRKLYLAR